MKIAFIGDTHFGYPRFEEDALRQGKEAFEKADRLADMIVHMGDFFHIKNPGFMTLKDVAGILKNMRHKVYAIYGNHERVPKGKTSALELLESIGLIELFRFGKKRIEDINFYAMNSVPEDLAEKALNRLKKEYPKGEGLNILLLHQDFKEFVKTDYGLSFDDVQGYDLVVNGHIHKHKSAMNRKFVIPGSTVITQLKEEEAGKKGFILYDSEKRDWEFIGIDTRPFIFKRIEANERKAEEIREEIEKIIEQSPNSSIIKIKVIGNVKGHLLYSDLINERIFIDVHSSKNKVKESIRRMKGFNRNDAIDLLSKNAKEIGFYDPELFELLQDLEEAEQYLERKYLGIEDEES